MGETFFTVSSTNGFQNWFTTAVAFPAGAHRYVLKSRGVDRAGNVQQAFTVGVDSTAAAAAAAERDHPDVYKSYLVLDMRRLSEAQRDELMNFDFNCMVCVDALAADEPAPNAFTEGFNLLAPDGWVAFHLSAETAEGGRDSRFARLIHRMIQSGAMNVG